MLLEWQQQKKWGAHADLGQLSDGVGKRFAVLGYGSIGRQSEFTTIGYTVVIVPANIDTSSGPCGQGYGYGGNCIHGH